MRSLLSPDVVVIGGGPAGCAASLRLLQLGRSVALLEHSDYDRPRLGEHLAPAVHPLLRELGAGEPVLEQPDARSAGIMLSWGDASVRHRDYMFDPYSYGYRLDRRRFDQLLVTRVSQAGGSVQLRARLHSLQQQADGTWSVSAVDSGKRAIQLTARFVVDATGRAARVGRILGCDRRRFDRLLGVAAWFRSRRVWNRFGDRLVLESAEMGWWYALALPADWGVIVFMTDADLIRERSPSIQRLWQSELKRTNLIRSKVAELPCPTELAIRSAGTSILEPMHGPSWAAVGEAGVTHDPLSGRGILDALQSGLRAGTAIARALDGDTFPLSDFARDRRAQFDRYLDQRRDVYQQEQRWAKSRFWSRRHDAWQRGTISAQRSPSLSPRRC